MAGKDLFPRPEGAALGHITGIGEGSFMFLCQGRVTRYTRLPQIQWHTSLFSGCYTKGGAAGRAKFKLLFSILRTGSNRMVSVLQTQPFTDSSTASLLSDSLTLLFSLNQQRIGLCGYNPKWVRTPNPYINRKERIRVVCPHPPI